MVKKRRVFVCLALNVPERSTEALSRCGPQKKKKHRTFSFFFFTSPVALICNSAPAIPTASGRPQWLISHWKYQHARPGCRTNTDIFFFFFLSFCSTASKPALHGCVSRIKIYIKNKKNYVCLFISCSMCQKNRGGKQTSGSCGRFSLLRGLFGVEIANAEAMRSERL